MSFETHLAQVLGSKSKRPLASSAAVSAQRRRSHLHPAESAGGFVLDYNTVEGSADTFTFEAYQTYYVAGYFSVAHLTIGDGAVIKFDENIPYGIDAAGPASWPGGYRALLTSMNDNSEGATIEESTGQPSTGACT